MTEDRKLSPVICPLSPALRFQSALTSCSRATAPRPASARRGTRSSSGPLSASATCCVSVSCPATRGSQAGGELVAEAGDDRLRRAGRREHAPPGIGLEPGKTALAHGRHRAERRRARLAGLHDRPDATGLDLRDRQRCAADEQVDVAGNDVVHGRSAAAIGHVNEPHSRLFRQQRHGEVADAAAADRGVAHRVGLGLGARSRRRAC